MEHVIRNIQNPKKLSGFWADFIVNKRFYWVLQIQTLSETKEFLNLFEKSPVWKEIFTHIETNVEPQFLIEFVNYMQDYRSNLIKTRKLFKNTKELCPATRAIWQGDIEFLQFLSNCSVDLRNDFNTGATLFHLACLTEHPEVVKFLLNTKLFDVNAKKQGLAPLHAACMQFCARKHQKLEVIEVILKLCNVDLS